jgi:hypothetical protein
MVLDTINALAEDIVLQVQQLEAGMYVLDEGADEDSQFTVTEGYCINGQATQLVSKLGHGE